VYPFEEIGDISRGGRLTFDRYGRLAVVQNGSYIALNDNVWTDLAASDNRLPVLQAATESDGTTYYGALGDWGLLVPGADGKLHAESIAPKHRPDWVAATNFTEILFTSDRIYFAGWNGVAVWNRAARTHQFIAVPQVNRVFEFEGKVYVSSNVRGVSVVDSATATLAPAGPPLRELVVDNFARFGSGDALISASNHRLLRWRNGSVTEVPGLLEHGMAGPTSLQALADGDVAVAVTNVGLYIVDRAGRIKLALTSPEYRRITALAANEPGVLWAETETAIVKIFYANPVTVFGQSLGMPIEWPQIVSWNGHVVVASGGHVYQSVVAGPGEPIRFERMSNDPGPGAWGLATVGPWLLTGNRTSMFACQAGHEFQQVLNDIDAARLAATASGLCYVVGPKQIAVVRCANGTWRECAPRIDGVGFPAIVHAAGDSVWIELGVNRAARVTLREGRLEARLFTSFPWSHPDWVNISVVGTTVMLTGPDAQRLYFDERTGSVTDAPELERIVAECPSHVFRVVRDDGGTVWASLAHGMVTLTPGNGHPVAVNNYELNNEATPTVHPLPHQDIWVTTGDSLYHVDTHRAPPPPAAFHPLLVSVRDARTNAELFSGMTRPGEPARFGADQNSLALTFFAGSYRSRRPPRYEHRLGRGAWLPSTTDSLISLTDLHEGRYHLEVRLADARGPLGMPGRFDFSIAPPWYRAWYAVVAYPILVGLLLFALVRYSVRRAEARSAALERVVALRTSELKTAMEKLQHETQTTATLAERNRLAGEIHDSLEQGFTGLQLQLETTASFPACPPDVKSGLSVALNMVAFSRNEVRHAVRNLHSPMLESADLTTALRHVVTQIAPEANYATVSETGTPRRLGSTTEHHLLRIAQEAMANAVKHARATHVDVTIDYGDDQVRLSIRDNGCGFDPVAVLKSEPGHFGLPSFRGRAGAIGGTVEITSSCGGGTAIVVRVPVASSSL
jgi:signal transduction histidine kinase